MTPNEALERTLKAYEPYYTVQREGVTPPFQAEALFTQREERYFISRGIRLSESSAQERVFFAIVETLDETAFRKLDEAAWSRGLALVEPKWGCRGSDIGLVILANGMESEAARLIRAANRSKGYAFSMKGWTNYRVIALDLSTGAMAHNRLGRQTGGTLRRLLQIEEVET